MWVLEEAPPARPSGPSRTWQILALSARSGNALESMAAALHDQLDAHPGVPLADIAYTLQTGRKGFSHRAIALCHDREDAIDVFGKP